MSVSYALDGFLSAMKDVETGYRGYAIVGTAPYLEPYTEATAALRANAAALQSLAARAGIDVAPVVSLSRDELSYASGVISARERSGDEARMLVQDGRGKQVMDELRAQTAAIHSQISSRVLRNDETVFRIFALLAGVSLIGLVLSGIVLSMRASRDRRKATRLQALLEDVFKRAPVGLALVNRFGIVEQTNPAFLAMVGAQPDESRSVRLSLMSRPLAETVIPDLRAISKSDGAAIPAPDPRERRETTELQGAEGPVFVDVAVFPVTLSDDERTGAGVGVVLTDMTHRREWEAEIERERDRAKAANRSKSAFIANMSHELRTPITAVMGYCELLEEEARDRGEETFLADLGKIGVNARHLLGLINDVLDFSKMEADRLEIHPVEFKLSTMLGEVADSVESLMTKNGNAFEIVDTAGDLVLFSDDLRVRQVLLNLLSNAAKFSNQGRVELRVETLDRDGVGWLRFVVSDTGIGMSEDQVAGLFRRFSQADETTTRKYGGTGLGLALSKAIAEMLGGEISVESEPGRGSRFTLDMPRVYSAPQPVEEEASETDARAPVDAQGASVLVIDDDPHAREFLTRSLTRSGFSVLTETDGQSGLATARRVRPLAILLDVMLPGLDGWHVLRELRADPQTADIPVIIQTVLDERNFAYALGAAAYLRKPISRDDLTATVAEFASPAVAGHALVVDDDRAAAQRLSQMLERDGWSVAWAADGVEALAEMAKKKPTLALVDLLMPGMDGYAFVRKVRADPRWNDVRIVVLTADDVALDRVRALARSTSGVVQKGAMPLADLVRDLRRFAGAGKSAAAVGKGEDDGSHIADRGQ